MIFRALGHLPGPLRTLGAHLNGHRDVKPNLAAPVPEKRCLGPEANFRDEAKTSGKTQFQSPSACKPRVMFIYMPATCPYLGTSYMIITIEIQKFHF